MVWPTKINDAVIDEWNLLLQCLKHFQSFCCCQINESNQAYPQIISLKTYHIFIVDGKTERNCNRIGQWQQNGGLHVQYYCSSSSFIKCIDKSIPCVRCKYMGDIVSTLIEKKITCVGIFLSFTLQDLHYNMCIAFLINFC